MYEAKRHFGGSVMGAAAPPEAMGYVDRPARLASPLEEATEALEHSISEAMGMVDSLASRLSPILCQAAPTAGSACGETNALSSSSAAVETVRRLRSRVLAIQAQVGDLLNRVEV